MTSQYVSRLERAVADAPRRVELGKVAAVFGMTVDDLMGLDDQPEPANDGDGPSDDEINAAISDLLSDTGVMLAFMSDVREPGRLSRTARLDILNRLRTLKARQQRPQG